MSTTAHPPLLESPQRSYYAPIGFDPTCFRQGQDQCRPLSERTGGNLAAHLGTNSTTRNQDRLSAVRCKVGH